MVEVEIKKSIDSKLVLDSEDAEELVNGIIRSSMTKEIFNALDNMSFIDMELNENNGTFDIKGSVILCSTQDMSTTAEIQAQMLSQFGMNQDQILQVLSVGIKEHGGF